MQKFANIDTVMEPAQISQTMSQDQTPSSGKNLMRSVTGLHSPSWTGIRSMLGDRGRRYGGDNPLSSQGDSNSISPMSSSESTSTSNGMNVGERGKTGKRAKAKEPKSYKSGI